MGLFNFFKPKWQHSSLAVRLKAVAGLPDSDLQILLRLASTDPEIAVRQAALSRIDDWRLLAPLASQGLDAAIVGEITHRIDTLQCHAVSDALGLDAKLTALAAISNDEVLAAIALSETEPEVRVAAIERIGNQAVLADLVTKNCGKGPALSAIDKIDDEALLRMAAKLASNRVARARAQGKLDEILAIRNRPDPETERQLELSGILERVALLAGAVDSEAALNECRQLERRWREIAGADPRRGELDQHCTLIRGRHQQRADEAEARRLEEEQQSQVLQRLQQIMAEIEALAAKAIGGEGVRLQALEQQWDQLIAAVSPPLSDTLALRYHQTKERFAQSRTRLSQEQEEEAELLRLLDTVATLIGQLDLEQASITLAEAQRIFDGWHPELISRQPAAERLGQLRELREAGAARRDQMEQLQLETNWQRRQGLLTAARALLASDDVKAITQRFAGIRAEWQHPMELPAGVADLAPEFAAAGAAIEERLDAARKEESWRRWQNKNLKAQLTGEAEALAGETDLRRVFKRIKELQEQWRATGPAPAKEEPALWQRFHEATERNFARCREFFQELDAEAERNLEEKTGLRDQAIACQDSSEWQKTAEFIKALQSQWKGVGRGPQDKEQEVFTAFRAACDHFFERRKAHHAALDLERQANLDRKTALCQEAEALADQPEAEKNKKIQELQADWKAIGPVPRDQEEAIWQRFRAACDRYYAWLDSLRPENLTRKEALCVEAEALASKIGPETNFVQLVKKIAALQRKWKEIGPVPQEVQDAVWQRFKGYCDLCFEAKARHDQIIDQQRPGNLAEKEALLFRVRELSAGQTVTKETVREIIAIQESWQAVGLAAKDREEQLQRDFKTACDGFFKERREAFQVIDQLQRENVRKKEALCLRLEILAGVTPSQPAAQPQGKQTGLTLAEQLKVAFETNFVLSADDEKNRKRRAKDEIDAVTREWQQIGPVPREHEHAIRKRYAEALAMATKAQP